MKQFFLLVFIMSYGISSAQFVDRKEVEGNIKVPPGSEAEGITIFNKNSGSGTVSLEKGDFYLLVKAGDSVYFSAVQYGELLVVIDEEIVTTGKLLVEISEGVNQLPEVIVRPHDLTGNIKSDAENIEVVAIPLPPMAMNINENLYEMRPDMQTGVKNAAMGEGLQYGANILGILEKVVRLVIPEKRNKPEVPPKIGLIELERRLRATFDNAFFEQNFGLPSEQISDFIAYMEAEAFPQELLRNGKELDLLQYLMEESEEFRNLSE